jgi:hypothetical protein
MPLESILYLSFVVSALVLFASVLTYAERATRQLNNDSSTPEQNRKSAQRQPEETAPLRRAA